MNSPPSDGLLGVEVTTSRPEPILKLNEVLHAAAVVTKKFGPSFAHLLSLTNHVFHPTQPSSTPSDLPHRRRVLLARPTTDQPVG